jgi:hypothetical protein
MTDTIILHPKWTTDSELHFVESERKTVTGALDTLAVRFLRDDVVENAIAMTEHHDKFWPFHNPFVPHELVDTWSKVRDYFLFTQREYLKHKEFGIVLYPFDEGGTDDGLWTIANAPAASVTIADNSIEGTFVVGLNKRVLSNAAVFGPWATDEGFWAAVLAHEILHNLGHQHPYPDNCSFVREYENAVFRDGKWDRATEPGYTCAGSTGLALNGIARPNFRY